jgi:hypothetical protein
MPLRLVNCSITNIDVKSNTKQTKDNLKKSKKPKCFGRLLIKYINNTNRFYNFQTVLRQLTLFKIRQILKKESGF